MIIMTDWSSHIHDKIIRNWGQRLPWMASCLNLFSAELLKQLHTCSIDPHAYSMAVTFWQKQHRSGLGWNGISYKGERFDQVYLALSILAVCLCSSPSFKYVYYACLDQLNSLQPTQHWKIILGIMIIALLQLESPDCAIGASFYTSISCLFNNTKFCT